MRTVLVCLAVSVAACGGDDDSANDGGSSIDAMLGSPDATPGCERAAAAADRPRKMVVSRPFAGGNMSELYEVLDVATDGTVTQPSVTFSMHRASDGRIAFTRDGEVGIVAQNDGTLGVFRFDSSGAPVVVHAGFDANGADGFYAGSVVMGPESRIAYVLNSQWRKHGGGIHSVAIECDGTLTYLGNVAAARLPYAMSILPNGKIAVAADDILDQNVTNGNAYLVDVHGGAVLGGVDVFGDGDAIVGSATATHDGRFFLLGDVGEIVQGAGDRVGVVELSDTGLQTVHVVANVRNPFDMIASPFDDYTTLVVSGFGDAFYGLSYNASTPLAPFSAAELTYVGASPQLPGAGVMIAAGAQKGLVFVAENQGIRRVRFLENGGLADLGMTSFGSGGEHITGAIGVQP